RGTPTLYYGDEIGMENVTIPPEKILDPQGKNTSGFNRDEARTPMQWDNTPNAGFAPKGVETWLPLAPDYQQVNVAAQRDDSRSLLTLCRRLLAFRREKTALHRGRYQSVDGVPIHCFVYLRQWENETYLIALNFSDKAEPITIS